MTVEPIDTDNGAFLTRQAQRHPEASPPARSPAKISAGAIITSMLGWGPIPFTQVPHAFSLVAEQRTIGHDRTPAVLSNREKGIRSRAEAKATTKLRKQVKSGLDPAVEACGALAGKRNVLHGQIGILDSETIVGPHGEMLDLETAATQHQALVERIATDNANGHVVHRPANPRTRRRAKRLPLFDFPILTYFMAGVFNVDLTRPLESPADSLAAALFGLLGTIGIAVGFSFFGRQHRSHKNHQGQWSAPRGGRIQLGLELLGMTVLLLSIGAVMSYRVYNDAIASEIDPLLSIILATMFGGIAIILNCVVYFVEFRDGSIQTERLDALAGGLDTIHRAQQGLRGQVDILTEELGRRVNKADRLAQNIDAAADQVVLRSPQDRVILYARAIHQGTDSGHALPAPAIDRRPLDQCRAQLTRLSEIDGRGE